MAHSYAGAVLEFIQRELASRYHRDLVLRFETGPTDTDQLTRITKDLRQKFPSFRTMAAGGDEEGLFKVSVRIRTTKPVEQLRQELASWASNNEPFVRNYSVRRRSWWD